MEQLVYIKDDIKEYETKVNALIKETHFLSHEVKCLNQSNKQLISKLSHNKKKINFLKDISNLISIK